MFMEQHQPANHPEATSILSCLHPMQARERLSSAVRTMKFKSSKDCKMPDEIQGHREYICGDQRRSWDGVRKSVRNRLRKGKKQRRKEQPEILKTNIGLAVDSTDFLAFYSYF
jgi:hypothetical protein